MDYVKSCLFSSKPLTTSFCEPIAVPEMKKFHGKRHPMPSRQKMNQESQYLSLGGDAISSACCRSSLSPCTSLSDPFLPSTSSACAATPRRCATRLLSPSPSTKPVSVSSTLPIPITGEYAQPLRSKRQRHRRIGAHKYT